jgi:RND family efflux transporter MFP subunit
LPGALVLLAAVLAAGCGQAAKARVDKTVEVVVTAPVADQVLDYQDFTGRLDAFRTVDMRPRVSGYIVEAPFKEGDRVEKGKVLFTIDDRIFSADLAQAEANLKLAIADRALQDVNSSRARQMIRTRSIGQEEYDQVLANREKSRATVGSMQAARDKAAVYVGYTRVKCPMDGRISRRFVDPGNLVNQDQTLLTTIVADHEVYAYFDVDERTYLHLVGDAAGTSSRSLHESRFPVLMSLAGEKEFTRDGYVDFVDNRLNGNTGTIRMRGVFANPGGLLKSGLFVRVRLPLGKPYPALLIPDEALMSDQGRKYVYVVNAANEVVYRRVTLGQARDGLRVIKPPARGQEGQEGLLPGEKVIVVGMQRVRPKDTVQVKEKKTPRPSDAPMKKLLNLTRTETDPPRAVGQGPPAAGRRDEKR